jgi:hypothetical protein
MKLSRLLAPCIFFYSFFSCKKTDLLAISAGTYSKADITASGSVRVFCSAGEIIDPGIRNRFVTDDNSYFESGANLSNNGLGQLDVITFTDAQTAVVNEDYQSYNCSIATDVPLILFSRIDTSRSFTYDEVRSHQITYYIAKIKPQVFAEDISSSSGNTYVFSFTGIEKFVAIQENNQLKTPFLQFIVHRVTGSGSYFHYYRINNILQPDFYLHLPAGDTVVLREYRVSYKKQ